MKFMRLGDMKAETEVVTDTNIVTDNAFDTRNGEEPESLEDAAARISALGASSMFAPSEEQWEKMKLARAAQSDCDSCGKCGRELAKGETVWRVRMGMGRAYFGGNGFAIAPECEQCRFPYRRYLSSEPCGNCTRPVINQADGKRRYRRRVYCSTRCEQERTPILLQAARAERRQQREYVCKICDMLFTPSRKDSVHCSNTCRQRDYRRRKVAQS